jgi:hypothetical protein
LRAFDVEISFLEQVDCVFCVGMPRVDRDNRVFFAIDLCHLLLLISDRPSKTADPVSERYEVEAATVCQLEC